MFPLPDEPEVTVIHPVLLTAVQEAAGDTADTATLPVVAAAPTLAMAGFKENGAVAACVTLSENPVIAMTPDRAIVVVFAATE